MIPTRPLSSFKRPHSFNISPEDISTPFWVQLGGKQGTVALALQDFWDRYFSPKQAASTSAASVPAGAREGGADPTQSASGAPGSGSSSGSAGGPDGKGKERERKDSRFPQTTFDSGEDEFHWVTNIESSIQQMIQGMVELSCNVYSQLECTWIGKPFFFIHMMQLDSTQRMFDLEEGSGNPLDSMPLEQILAMIEIFFAHNALAALFSKSMLIEQCKEYKLGRDVAYSSSSAADNAEREHLPPPSPLLLTTVIAEAIPDSVEDEEDELVVNAANRLRKRLQRYAESLLFSTSVEPATVAPSPISASASASASAPAPDFNPAETTTQPSSATDQAKEEETALYDLSTIQALVLIGARELCEGTSPRKSACYVGVVARMLSHMRAKERAAPHRKNREDDRVFTGATYRAVNEEIRINLEWFITAIAAWFFCQLERPLGQILPPASILRFPPLRICRSASLQMDKRRWHITSLRRQAYLVEQLWTCATVTVTVCLIHDLHPSSQERQRAKVGATAATAPGAGGADKAGAEEQQKMWQEERTTRDLQDLGKPKFNMLELCERIQRYLDDYLKDMEKNKAPPSALAYLEASF
ncbi:hypothetical protein OC844_007873, partial [Tilletia horrida]